MERILHSVHQHLTPRELFFQNTSQVFCSPHMLSIQDLADFHMHLVTNRLNKW